MQVITSFRGEYSFLSNFYVCPVEIDGLKFNSSEAAFQSFKDLSKQRMFTCLTAKNAKSFGRKVALREDWDEIKIVIMRDVVRAKFLQNPSLAHRLLETGDAILIEGNTWGDTYFGRCRGVGHNYLGKVLMLVRKELREDLGGNL